MNTKSSLTSKNIMGLFLLSGILTILCLHLFLTLPLATTFGFFILLTIIAIFLYNPIYGFVLIIILRTLSDFFAGAFSISVTDNISLNIASILALVIIVMSTVIFIIHYREILRIPLLIPFALLIFFTGFSLSYSIDTLSTFHETLRVLSIFASFGATYLLCKNTPNAHKIFITSILLSSIVPLSFAFFQLLTGSGITDNTGIDGRLFGTFKHPNSFASFLIIIIAILTYRFSAQNKKISQNLPTLTLLFITISFLLLTFSRGGWLALIIFFGIFGFIKAPKLPFAIIGLTILLFFTSQTVHDRIEDIYNPPADSSIRWRIRQWQEAVTAWKLSPIYGYGAGTEVAIHTQQQGFYAGNPYTHNDLVKALQETGIIGLTIFVLLLTMTFILLLNKYRTTPDSRTKLFILIVLLLFVSEIIFGMTSNIWRSTAIEWLLWVLIACALSGKAKVTN